MKFVELCCVAILLISCSSMEDKIRSTPTAELKLRREQLIGKGSNRAGTLTASASWRDISKPLKSAGWIGNGRKTGISERVRVVVINLS